MIITAHQPNYLPWLGLFHKTSLADTICILDSVQFSKGDFINRNKIKVAHGDAWLTIPIKSKGSSRKSINEIECTNDNWKKSHLALIGASYRDAQYFDTYWESFSNMLHEIDTHLISNINIALLQFLLSILGIEIELVRSSKLEINKKKSDFLVEMCQKLNSNIYISGYYGRNYLEKEKFSEAGIEVRIQKYKHPIYNQQFGDFKADLSIVDLIFNHGPRSLDILLKDNARNWKELEEL